MKSVLVKKFVKLGTALRYLIDLREGEQLAGGRVLENIQAVLDLIEELGFTAVDTNRLRGLKGELNSAAASRTSINSQEANRLEAVCRKVRSAVLAEGSTIHVHYLSAEELEAASSPGWPERLTVPLLAKTPFSIWRWLVGIVVAAFLLGLWFAQTNAYQAITKAFGPFMQGSG